MTGLALFAMVLFLICGWGVFVQPWPTNYLCVVLSWVFEAICLLALFGIIDRRHQHSNKDS